MPACRDELRISILSRSFGSEAPTCAAIIPTAFHTFVPTEIQTLKSRDQWSLIAREVAIAGTNCALSEPASLLRLFASTTFGSRPPHFAQAMGIGLFRSRAHK
jgi:hypothetical protein